MKKTFAFCFLFLTIVLGCSKNQSSYNESDLIYGKYDSVLMTQYGFKELLESDLAPYVTCLLKGQKDLLKTIDFPHIDTTNIVVSLAFKNHHPKLVRQLLDMGCSTCLNDSSFYTIDENPTLLNLMSMSDTLSSEEFECIKIVVEHGVNINHVEGISGWTPLLKVCQCYHIGGKELAKYLLEKGADVNYCHYSLWYHKMSYPLLTAFEYNRTDLIELFLEYWAYPHNKWDYLMMKDYLNSIEDKKKSSILKTKLEEIWREYNGSNTDSLLM